MRLSCTIVFAAVFLSISCSRPNAPESINQAEEPLQASYNIALLSWNGGQKEADAAERLIKRYRSAADGGVLLFVSGQEKSGAGPKSFAEAAMSLAKNDRVRAIVFCPGPAGTSDAVAKIKAMYPAMLCYVAMPMEEPLPIQASGADLIISFAPGAETDEYALCAGLGEYAKTVVDGLAGKDALVALVNEIKEYSMEKNIKARHYLDPESMVHSKNHIELYYGGD
ncbi:hypothetical protein MASR2M29_05250 [Spirochaetota bacterium]